MFTKGTKIQFNYRGVHTGTISDIIPLEDGGKKFVINDITAPDGQPCDTLWLYQGVDEDGGLEYWSVTDITGISSKMKCQVLYDLRESLGFCSGNELHEYFESVTGDPSPSGHVEIDADHAYEFVIVNSRSYAWNNGGDWQWYSDTEAATSEAIQPTAAVIATARKEFEAYKARYEAYPA